MEKVHRTWSCPVCGKPTVQLVKVGTSAGVADLCDYRFLPTFGGWKETSPRHSYPFCKDHIERKEDRS